jgi:hypothetical protein
LLIVWQLTDDHQLLSTTLNRLDESVSAADASAVPSTYAIHRGGPSPTESMAADGRDLSAALELFSEKFAENIQTGNALLIAQEEARSSHVLAQEKSRSTYLAAQERLRGTIARLNSLHDQQRESRRLKFCATMPEEIEFYQGELEGIAEEIEMFQTERRQLERIKNE